MLTPDSTPKQDHQHGSDPVSDNNFAGSDVLIVAVSLDAAYANVGEKCW